MRPPSSTSRLGIVVCVVGMARLEWWADRCPQTTIAVSLVALVPLTSAVYIPNPATHQYTFNNLTSNVTTSASTWWLERIPKQGIAAFNPNPSGYKVFRNVKDYGAKGGSYF